MPWVTWIETEPDDTSNEDVQALYKQARNPMNGEMSDLTRITSLTPTVSGHLDRLCAAVYRNASGLSLREKEIAALVTSAFVGCVH